MPIVHPRKIRINMLGYLPWMGANAVRAKWLLYTTDKDKARSESGDNPAIEYRPDWPKNAYAFTDGKVIAFHADVIEQTPEFEVVLTAGHETLHYSLAHPERMHGKNPMLFNVAADDRVNRMLRALLSYEAQNNQLNVDMPGDKWIFLEGPQWDADIKPEMTVEEVYLVLLRRMKQHQMKCPSCGGTHGKPQNAPGNSQNDDKGQGGSQGTPPTPGNTPQPGQKTSGTREWGKGAPKGCSDPAAWELEKMMEQMAQDIMVSPEPDPHKRDAEAYDKQLSFQRKIQEAVSKGNLPGKFGDMVQITPPKQRWDDAVANFVAVNRTKQDFTTKKPQKQYHQQGLIMSTLYDEKPTILMVIDTSGSVPSDHIGQFLGVALAICNYGNRVVIIECDTEVYEGNIKTLEPGQGNFEDPNLGKITGRGGTYFRPPLQYAQKLLDEGEDIGGIMYFTDAGNFDKLEAEDYPPGVPVLWVLTTDGMPNGEVQGEVVRFDPNER